MANIGINITKNGTTTLATAGKYCDRNIDVNVDVAGAGGGGIPEEGLIITGNCKYKFCFNNWNWFIEAYKDKIITKDIELAHSMFYYSNSLTEIPFDLNFKGNSEKPSCFYSCYQLQKVGNLDFNYGGGHLNSFFYGSYELKEIGTIKNIGTPEKQYNTPMSNFFRYCKKLRQLPNIENVYLANNSYLDNIFGDCYSLRSIPQQWMDIFSRVNHTSQTDSLYKGLCCYNYCIDEILNIPVDYYDDSHGFVSNAFTNAFKECYHLKNLTFATNEDGSAKIARWKNQTIDLSSYIGYANNAGYIYNYNSGLTVWGNITNSESYNTLKDNPDSWTMDINYSRYNHDSAVATINSLPDTSAYLSANGGTNTIKFNGAAGALTDGGAINTLTEAEIAVAAAKGWTISLV